MYSAQEQKIGTFVKFFRIATNDSTRAKSRVYKFTLMGGVGRNENKIGTRCFDVAAQRGARCDRDGVGRGATSLAPAKALETSDLVGWWIALDDTLPKLWKQGAIKAQDQVVQINADGTVSDRMMNFWAGGAQACLEGKVCSDLPELATAKIAVNSNRVSFSEVKPTQARVDSVAGNLLVRQETVTAIPEWTATLDGQRLTLRATGVTKVRTLVRIDPDRLRRLHAGMRTSAWSA